jgi:hypothetical protein
MAKQAASSLGIEAMAIQALPVDYGPDPGFATGTRATGEEYDYAKWLGERIKEITGMSAEERQERIERQQISVLDPDLAANRSFSLAFKVQEQKRRNVERYLAREHKNLVRELAEYLKRQALS